jgi:rare lipoprotein A
MTARLTPTLLVLFVCAALSACVSSPIEPQGVIDREAIITPERTRAGNPPEYEIAGERYYVQDSSADYRERGVASWYGKDFHGRSTSNGETYDMYGLSAAHKTLPIPTWVEVTHLGNGRRIIVRVNDRGPFVDGRIIDLSYGAASELDMIDAGTARVEVRALGVPVGGEQPRPEVFAANTIEPRRSGFSLISEAAAAEPGPSDRPMQQVFAQVGAFSDQVNAARLVDKLRASGQRNVFLLSESIGSGQLHRVRIGPLADVAAYDDIRRDLISLGVRDSLLVVVN